MQYFFKRSFFPRNIRSFFQKETWEFKVGDIVTAHAGDGFFYKAKVYITHFDTKLQ